MMYRVYLTTKSECERVEADEILWGNGVVQFLKKPETNSLIQIETNAKPIVTYSFNQLIKVVYEGDADA